uniref:Uncharacterized protein n=1 Tax=Moniliophthora roreri TaxID=221103 RepID=A0A0W0FU76_MONRR
MLVLIRTWDSLTQAIVITSIFTELGRRNAITSRLWFELVWTGICSLLQLSGAIAASVVVPQYSCDALDPLGCISAKVLIAFAWMNAIILSLYVTAMATFLIIYSKQDSRIWQHNIHNLPESRNPKMNKPPPIVPPLTSFPPLSSFGRNPASIVAPQPRRPAAPTMMYSYRSGLSPDYRIEHFQPTDQLPPFEPSAPEGPEVPKPQPSAHNALYPKFMMSSLASSSFKEPSPVHQSPSSTKTPTPPPLGRWPRADIMSLPSHSKAPSASPTSLIEPISSRGHDRPPPPPHIPHSPPSSPRSRPTGPRTPGSRTVTRPQPLDLSEISAHRERGKRREG